VLTKAQQKKDVKNESYKNARFRIKFKNLCVMFKCLDITELRNVRKNVFKSISPFARSHLGSAELVKLAGKKLLFPAATRWSTLPLTYDRALELLVFVNQIAAKQNWPLLDQNTVAAMRNVVTITEDLTTFNITLQSDTKPTISLLFGGIVNILKNLEVSDFF
jgi:hypothetical protein